MSSKHQLNVHLDYGIQCFELGGLEVRYGYHYSGEHQLREQLVQIPARELEKKLATDLDALYEVLRVRIPDPSSVRLAHAEIVPTIRPGGLTFVVLDQAREKLLPIARLYYYEIVEPLRSNIERRVYLGACRELAPSKQESTTYEPSLVCKLLILGCRPLIPDRLLERPDWTSDELKVCRRVAEAVRKIAWNDYSHLRGHHLFGAAEEEQRSP